MKSGPGFENLGFSRKATGPLVATWNVLFSHKICVVFLTKCFCSLKSTNFAIFLEKNPQFFFNISDYFHFKKPLIYWLFFILAFCSFFFFFFGV